MSCPGGVIAKMVESVRVTSRTDDAPLGGLTRALRPEDLDDDASLSMCPMVYQERIAKVADLRVTVVGRRLFAASVRAGDVLDWRGDPTLVSAFVQDELPPEVARAVLAYCERVGIQLAAFDLVRAPDGELVFIEANTTSFFDFVERATGLPIADAIADLVLGRA